MLYKYMLIQSWGFFGALVLGTIGIVVYLLCKANNADWND